MPIFFGCNQTKDVAKISKIKHWVQEIFELTESETIFVTELQCHEEECPSLETVIAVFIEGAGKEQYKFHKRLDEIDFEDIENLSTQYPR